MTCPPTDTEAPEAESPEAESPESPESPEAESPDAESPEVESSEAELFEIYAPLSEKRYGAGVNGEHKGEVARPGAPPDLGDAELVIGRFGPYLGVALIEEGRTVEAYFEEEQSRELVGGVYVGRVQRYLPGMDCVFVELGLSRTAYLPTRKLQWGAVWAASTSPSEREGMPTPESVGDALRPGRRLMVQVERDPVGAKGARLTTDIGLAGRFGVYFPFGRGVGVSQRITNPEERERLREAAQRVCPEEGGYVVRTAAKGADEADLGADALALRARWVELRDRAGDALPTTRLHAEPPVALRALRELLGPRVARVYVDPSEVEGVRAFVGEELAELADRVEPWTRSASSLVARGVISAVQGALQPVVELPSGGSIVIESTEAMTVVDVNSGGFTGRVDLRATALQTNLEAVRIVAAQLRLRNIGGIVVIDLIDMESNADRRRVDAELLEHLARDRAKTRVLPTSEFGLVQLTRQRLRPSLATVFADRCRTCEGSGVALNGIWLGFHALRQVRERSLTGVRLVQVDAPRRVADALKRHFSAELREIETRFDLSVQIRSTADARDDVTVRTA